MVTAVVSNHGVENSRFMCSATCTCYVVKKTWRREDMIVAALTAFFRLQREPNLQSGRIVVIIRMLRTAGWRWQPYLQEIREQSCCEGRQHIQIYLPLPYLTLTLTLTNPTFRPSPATVQRMQGKLTLSSVAWCMCMSSFLCLICCCH